MTQQNPIFGDVFNPEDFYEFFTFIKIKDEIICYEFDYEEFVDRKNLIKIFYEVLSLLKFKHQYVLAKRHMQEMYYEEIACLCGVSKQAIEVMDKTALRKFKEKFIEIHCRDSSVGRASG